MFDTLRLSCFSDINECKNGTHDCDQDNGTCLNTPGSYTCQCKPGYAGNGRHCSGISYLVSRFLGMMYSLLKSMHAMSTDQVLVLIAFVSD